MYVGGETFVAKDALSLKEEKDTGQWAPSPPTLGCLGPPTLTISPSWVTLGTAQPLCSGLSAPWKEGPAPGTSCRVAGTPVARGTAPAPKQRLLAGGRGVWSQTSSGSCRVGELRVSG